MTKTIHVTDETVEIIQRKVDEGLYADVETAFAEAARLLDEYDYNKELRAKLQEGIDQAERGETVPWTRELSRQILEQAKELHRLGIRPDDDVCP